MFSEESSEKMENCENHNVVDDGCNSNIPELFNLKENTCQDKGTDSSYNQAPSLRAIWS